MWNAPERSCILLPSSRAHFCVERNPIQLSSPELLKSIQGAGRVGKQIETSALITRNRDSAVVDAVVDPVRAHPELGRELRDRETPREPARMRLASLQQDAVPQANDP